MIALGSDHAGFYLKEEVRRYLDERGIKYKDFGANSEESVNYAEYAEKVANSIVKRECKRGIVICGTGIGISIAANKVNGIRAAACSDYYSAIMSRRHNDSNILALGARVVGPGLALTIVEGWLNEDYEGDRHQERLDYISEIEARNRG
ncbi:MAG: ribose 5-phosphate isomerase B [Clostridiales bacterium]|nr:ribose 5-phosphate isomerase B [Clostridiales bacterium]